jgi:hypothetical protein
MLIKVPVASTNRAQGPHKEEKMDSKLLAVVALALSLVALGLTVYGRYFDHPLGKGLKGYDLTSPEKAYQSKVEMNLAVDINAFREMNAIFGGKEAEDKLKSFAVEKTGEYAGKKILFVKWTTEGVDRYEIRSFEKHVDSGLWEEAHLSAWSVDDESLSEEMKSWEKRDPK